MRLGAACLSCTILAVTAAAFAQAQVRSHPRPVHNIHLSAKSDISDAATVNRAISVMASNVASCSPSLAKNPEKCACSFRDDMQKLKAAYDTAVAKHVGWSAEETVVSYEVPGSGTSVTINFPAVKRQIEACSKR